MVDEVDLKLKRLHECDTGLFVNKSKHPQLTKRNDDDAGIDLCAILKGDGIETEIYSENGCEIVTNVDEIVIPPRGGRAFINTQTSVKIPDGYYGRVAPRSGLARFHGIDIGGGVVDASYRGMIGLIVFNFGFEPFLIQDGTRVAQLITTKIDTKRYIEVSSLDTTARGSLGYGSSGR